jgi:hypothetical protein
MLIGEFLDPRIPLGKDLPVTGTVRPHRMVLMYELLRGLRLVLGSSIDAPVSGWQPNCQSHDVLYFARG